MHIDIKIFKLSLPVMASTKTKLIETQNTLHRFSKQYTLHRDRLKKEEAPEAKCQIKYVRLIKHPI